MSRLVSAFAALAAACLLAGCQVAAPPVSTPSPTAPPTAPSGTPDTTAPTYMCTPEAGGAESECTQAQYDEMKAKDALYAEAEAVYRAYWAEVVRIMREGGSDEPTEVIKRTTSGFHQKDVAENLREMEKEGVQAKGDDPHVVWIRRLPGQSKEGSIVALSTCVDASAWGFYSGETLTTPGRVSVDDLYFDRLDGVLKIIGADGREVQACES